jgi:hypothetical protein
MHGATSDPIAIDPGLAYLLTNCDENDDDQLGIAVYIKSSFSVYVYGLKCSMLRPSVCVAVPP